MSAPGYARATSSILGAARERGPHASAREVARGWHEWKREARREGALADALVAATRARFARVQTGETRACAERVSASTAPRASSPPTPDARAVGKKDASEIETSGGRRLVERRERASRGREVATRREGARVCAPGASAQLGARCAWSGAAGRSPRPVGDPPAGAPGADSSGGDSERISVFPPIRRPAAQRADRRPSWTVPRIRIGRPREGAPRASSTRASTRGAYDVPPGRRATRVPACERRAASARLPARPRTRVPGVVRARILVVGEGWPNDVTSDDLAARRDRRPTAFASNDRSRVIRRASRPPRAASECAAPERVERSRSRARRALGLAGHDWKPLTGTSSLKTKKKKKKTVGPFPECSVILARHPRASTTGARSPEASRDARPARATTPRGVGANLTQRDRGQRVPGARARASSCARARVAERRDVGRPRGATRRRPTAFASNDRSRVIRRASTTAARARGECASAGTRRTLEESCTSCRDWQREEADDSYGNLNLRRKKKKKKR